MLRVVSLADGSELRKIHLGGYVGASPALAGGRAFVGTFENEVRAVELESGKLLWTYSNPERQFPYLSSAATDGKLVVLGGRDKTVHAIDVSTGKARWTRPESLEASWKPAGHALLVVRPRATTDATLARALALEGEGRPQEAAALYRQVLLVRPDSVRAWVDLGNAEADQGTRAAAEAAYRRALEIARDDQGALNNLAWLLLAEGTRLEEAEELAARAANQPGPDRPSAQDTLGRIQLARGRCAEAARTFREALAAEPASETTRAGLRDGLQRAERCAP